MDFTLPPRTFLKLNFNLKEISGQEKFLGLAAAAVVGSILNTTTIQQVKKVWSKQLLGIIYHDAYYRRAQDVGWVVNVGKGMLQVTEQGINHLQEIAVDKITNSVHSDPGLYVFMPGQTHTVDKLLRTLLSRAVTEVKIADSYVDETIFDNLLDQIPDGVIIKVLYGKLQGTYEARVKRFKIQYRGFETQNYPMLHDRFFILDGQGYIIGPSLKDAAKKSPALIVKLGAKDSQELDTFFNKIWT